MTPRLVHPENPAPAGFSSIRSAYTIGTVATGTASKGSVSTDAVSTDSVSIGALRFDTVWFETVGVRARAAAWAAGELPGSADTGDWR